MTKATPVLLSVLAVALLAGCGLSSEPEIIAELPLPTPAPAVVAPAQPPDLTRGASFFAEHCASCHGEAGRGDGQMVRDGRLPVAPPDFTDPATGRDKTPLQYMAVVTEGNVLAGMPPFSRYSAEERWDVAAYVYTLALDGERLALGAQVYEARCAVCHGPGGAGDGPEAVGIMPDFSDLALWAERSDAALFRAIRQEYPEMHAVAEGLSEAESWAVVGYLRTLAVTGTPGAVAGGAEQAAQPPLATEEVLAAANAGATARPQPEPATTEAAATEVAEAPEAPGAITVSGQVTNGTPGGNIPAGATLTLHMFDPPEFTESTLQTTLNEDGTYRFEDVPHQPGRAYLLSLQHEGVFFSSTVYTLQDTQRAALETSLEIFDITSDPAGILIDAGVMRITFSRFGLEVAEVLSINNTSDQLFLTDEVYSGNQRVALRFPLPPGATGVGFEPGMEGTRFFVSEDGTAVIDTQPVRPGGDDIFFSYLIPYRDGAIIEQEFLYPLVGQFHLLVEADQVTVESPMFAHDGERVDMGGQAFEAYIAEVNLAPGEVISYTLTGVPEAVAAAEAPQGGGRQVSPLVLVLAILGLLFIGVGGFLFLLRQGGDNREKAIEDLLQQIAELDDQHDQGMLNHDYYQRRRAALKADLADLMRGEGVEDDA